MQSIPRYQRGDKIAGRYLVHQALLGGMGEVYLCLDLEENYPFALKTFQQRYLTDPQPLRRAFEQEVATWVALEKHPNIVRCFWMQLLDNQPFMCLEWIAGEEGKGADLRSWLRHGPLDLKLALQIAIDICQGLLHAQTKRLGLVHCDLKPENILIAQGGLAKITDFGLAQLAQTAGIVLKEGSGSNDGRQSLFSGKGIVGTPAYMAPEQWRGEPLDGRTDIYALGCILYELLTGDSPFLVTVHATTPNRDAVWLHTLQQAHEQGPVAALPSGLPAALNGLVQRCLAKTPAARYADMTELLGGLKSLYQTLFDQAPRPLPTEDVFAAVDYNNRGYTYTELGLHEAALADYTQALILDQSLTQAYYNRGLAYARLGQHEAALADYTQALHLTSQYTKAYYNRGITYGKLGQREAALADFTQALIIDPYDVQAYVNRGNIYHMLEQYEAALADYTQALTFNANFTQAYNNRGNTYRVLKQYEAALADFTQALTIDPTFAQAYLNIGTVLGNQERLAEALPYFEKAAQLGDPQGAQYAAKVRQMLQIEPQR